jgi:hypothetical protein
VAGVIVHAGQARDHRRHARQRPQIGGEALPLRAPHQGALDTRQLPGGEPRFSTQSPRGLQAGAAALAPEVIPPMRRLARHPERPHDRRLGLALPEQPRRREPAGFQRGTASCSPLWRYHASASDGTR